MYNWRKLTAVQRQEALALRRGRKLPWHSPPHLDLEGVHQYLISAACFDHAPIVGTSPERMTQCEADVLQVCSEFCSAIHAWCVLPNHYHVVITTERIKELRHGLDYFMVGHLLFGTARISSAGVRSGTTASSAPSNRSAIFGRR